jgi:hypothetical protein
MDGTRRSIDQSHETLTSLPQDMHGFVRAGPSDVFAQKPKHGLLQ